ncbi:ATP-binding cassette domain-containing protein [Cohnella ginsengisoli]|uniref:ATP-binding cassette domain-containing protein n=1 Tax=Cohnella ginsengisoli TaxID=425004 RepID=A0A9X4KD26_9BACL|nr:ATP-binding cassette domain-containing protein [Cohnella ginsengisoli]MDG0789556.1 ATP-binding cassette domain-containing protein [Cohnella ginsengisoli]
MIELKNIVWRREEREILRGVDLTVKAGERWVLLGRNGCGKSTLLEMITGYLFPTSGTVDILGNRYGRVDVREVRKKIGNIGPSLIEKLIPRDPVWEIVVGGMNAYLRIYEEISEEIKARALAELDRVGLGSRAGQPFGTLSQGERKKALLARTMMADPQLLIMDEPCAGLDLFEREKFLDSLESLSKRVEGILYVTHHIEEIVPLFTHVALMAEGRIIAAGPKREVLTAELLRDAYEVPVNVRWVEDRPWITVEKEG